MPAGSCLEISVRSAPAENARPAPAKTRERLAATASDSNAARSSPSTADEIALSFSGRLRTSTQAAPSLRTSTSSGTGRHGLGQRPLAPPRKGDRRILGVDLARQSVAVEDRIRDELRRD